jgi:group I intron endonuclease
MNNIYTNTFIYYIVYETRNNVNGMTYIGCHATNNLNDGYLGSGKHLVRAIKKYGKENFTRNILHSLDNPQTMFEIETLLVTEEYVTNKNTYNLVVGGFGGFKIQNIEEWKQKLKESSSKRLNKQPALGLTHSEETKLKMSKANKGRPAWNKGLPGTWIGKSHTVESKEKISNNRKGLTAGEKNPMFGKSAVAGRKWYHNNIKSFYLFPTDPQVPFLISGRLPKQVS